MKTRLFFLITGMTFTAFSVGAQMYTLTDLGLLPDATGGIGRAVNDSGDVVGFCGSRAFLWTQENGIVELPLYQNRSFHAAYDINNAGVIVGTSGLEVSGPNAIRAVRWQNGTVENLGVIGTGAFSAAYGINDHGWITGYSYTTPNTSNQPFFYSDSTGMISISSLAGYGYDINNSGQITGYRSDNVHAFIWTPPNNFQDLGVPSGWANSYTFAINTNGVAVGGVISGSGNSERFARYATGTEWEVLGGIGEHNQLWGINSEGVAVGVFGNSATTAYRYTDQNGLQVIDSLVVNRGSWHVRTAFDVSETGLIAGSAYNPNFGTHPVLLTPVPELPAIEDLTISTRADSVYLRWSPSPGGELYRVHGASNSDFSPDPENMHMSTTNTFAVLPVMDSIFFYNVVVAIP